MTHNIMQTCNSGLIGLLVLYFQDQTVVFKATDEMMNSATCEMSIKIQVTGTKTIAGQSCF